MQERCCCTKFTILVSLFLDMVLVFFGFVHGKIHWLMAMESGRLGHNHVHEKI